MNNKLKSIENNYVHLTRNEFITRLLSEIGKDNDEIDILDKYCNLLMGGFKGLKNMSNSELVHNYSEILYPDEWEMIEKTGYIYLNNEKITFPYIVRKL